MIIICITKRAFIYLSISLLFSKYPQIWLTKTSCHILTTQFPKLSHQEFTKYTHTKWYIISYRIQLSKIILINKGVGLTTTTLDQASWLRSVIMMSRSLRTMRNYNTTEHCRHVHRKSNNCIFSAFNFTGHISSGFSFNRGTLEFILLSRGTVEISLNIVVYRM